RGVYFSISSDRGYLRVEAINRSDWLLSLRSSQKEARDVRIGLSIHQSGLKVLSHSTFERTRLFALVDVDVAIPDEKMLEVVNSLCCKPVYLKRTFKGWHLIYVAENWFSKDDTDKLRKLTDFVYDLVSPSLYSLISVNDFRKVEKKQVFLAETRIVDDSLYCLKLRDFYSSEEIDNLFDLDKRGDLGFMPLDSISVGHLDEVYRVCSVLRQLDSNWSVWSYRDFLVMVNYYALRFLRGDLTAKEIFVQNSLKSFSLTERELNRFFDDQVNLIKQRATAKKGFLYSCRDLQACSVDSSVCGSCSGYPDVYSYVRGSYSGIKFGRLDKSNILVYRSGLDLPDVGYGFIQYSDYREILNLSEKLSNKTFYLIFNTIEEAKYNFLELAGALYGKGAVEVKLVVFSENEGKSIGEVLEKVEDKQAKLKLLLSQAVEVLDYGKEEFEGREVVKRFLQVAIDGDGLEDLLEILKVKGFKKREAREVYYELLKEERERIRQKERQELEARVREIFKDDYKLPSGFYLRGDELVTESNALTIFFVVSKIFKSVEGNTYGYEIQTIEGDRFTIPIEDVNKANIVRFLNEKGLPTGEFGALIANYIAAFVRLNKSIIPEEVISERVGWYEDNYLLPQIIDDVKFDLKGYGMKGSKEEELKLLKEIIESGNILGIGYLSGIAALLIEPLETKNFVVFLSGSAGSGKTTTAALGLSLFGDYNSLLKNMNYTTAGLEILLNKNKDVVVVLDEVNTSNRDITQQLINTVYNFYNGIGRTRATTRLGLRDVATYRGVLMLTSENDLQQLLETSNTITKGALRRVLQFEFTEKLDRESIERVYTTIKDNYGNLIGDIVDYIKANKETLKGIYNDYVKELNGKYGLKDGLEMHTAVLLTALEILGKLFNVNMANMLATVLILLKAYNDEIKDELNITKEKLEEKIAQFVYENIQNFILSDIQQGMPKTIWGKIDDDCIYITQAAFKHLAKHVGLGDRGFKKLLAYYGLAESDGKRLIKNACFRIAGLKVNSFKINLIIKDNNTTGEESLDF
ncbi:MAG TPA: DUF927 domain-containing protein, partial [Thermodesulfobium narugense]|nr:DUF927 domain-containing protein [Thermodesulfobium narugense]